MRPSGGLSLAWRFCAVFCGEYFASADLIFGQYFGSEELKCSRARQIPDPLLGARHLSPHPWSGSFSRQQP